jgi:hypothetical protein
MPKFAVLFINRLKNLGAGAQQLQKNESLKEVTMKLHHHILAVLEREVSGAVLKSSAHHSLTASSSLTK